MKIVKQCKTKQTLWDKGQVPAEVEGNPELKAAYIENIDEILVRFFHFFNDFQYFSAQIDQILFSSVGMSGGYQADTR